MSELKEINDRLNIISLLLDKPEERLAQGEITEAKYKEISENQR